MGDGKFDHSGGGGGSGGPVAAAGAAVAAVDYRSGAADWNYHNKTMISDFETACLHQKFDFRDSQKQFGCTGSLCVKV